MGIIKQMSIKNRTYYFYDDMINIKEIDPNLLKLDKKSFRKYAEVWSAIKDQIEKINGSKLGEYGKDYMKTKFSSDDDLPLNKQLKFPSLTIIVITVFEEDDKYYPQIF